MYFVRARVPIAIEIFISTKCVLLYSAANFSDFQRFSLWNTEFRWKSRNRRKTMGAQNPLVKFLWWPNVALSWQISRAVFCRLSIFGTRQWDLQWFTRPFCTVSDFQRFSAIFSDFGSNFISVAKKIQKRGQACQTEFIRSIIDPGLSRCVVSSLNDRLIMLFWEAAKWSTFPKIPIDSAAPNESQRFSAIFSDFQAIFSDFQRFSKNIVVCNLATEKVPTFRRILSDESSGRREEVRYCPNADVSMFCIPYEKIKFPTAIFVQRFSAILKIAENRWKSLIEISKSWSE